jgi:hypothetical protein
MASETSTKPAPLSWALIKQMIRWNSILHLFPFLRNTSGFLRTTKLLSPFRLDQAVEAEQVKDGSIENLKILWPAEKVSLEPSELDRKFLKICKYFNDGFYARRNIFTCEVPGAYIHVGTGLVCTRDFKAIIDCHYDWLRLKTNPQFTWFKPLTIKRLPKCPPGTLYAVVIETWAFNWHHWLSENLVRLYSISKAYPGQRIVLLTPSKLRKDWKDSLAASLPANFELEIQHDELWVQVDRLILPSFVSARGNYHLPPGYYDTMRKTTFTNLGLPQENEPSERIYIPRPKKGHRRILNEDELIELLSHYGFKSILPEKLPFREQVDLFRRAEVVVSAYGANWGLNLYAGPIKNLVFYADKKPETYVFTFSKALGQEHHFLAGESDNLNTNFNVSLSEVKRILEEEMGLKPVV